MKLKSTNYIAFYLLNKHLREECHNEAEDARTEECYNVGEADVLDVDSDGWFKASPYGVFPGKTPGRQQHFGLAEGKLMESHFNSLRARLGRLFRGVPIYIGHPDVDRTLWPDERRLGKVVEMQARADGLWTRGEWNSLGEDNRENGFWIYPSPRWDGPGGGSQFRPDRLLSIGLTNMPRIVESEPMANAKGAGDYQDAAHAAGVNDAENMMQNENSETEISQQTKNMDRKLLIEKLGLAAEATDEEIMAKLDAVLKENADMAATEKAKLDTEAAKQSDANPQAANTDEDELKKARMEAANARVDLAVAEGRITLTERAAWIGRLTGDHRESEANALMALKPKLNTSALNLQRARIEIGDETQRRETIHNAVAAEQAKGKTYAEAYNAVRANPEFKAVFEAMKEPGREE
jgi:hypothetical protein